ncbi:phosphoenolpyruvate carboxykinase (GTP) [Desulfurococcus amylolyticus]|uniref:phosphoenolpyruvate carboxykinase (GTP) n=1 Tax=Desulfurococcus amylolyticus TaxID=94694 RepID=UPI0023F53782|nr:phosphoenolpyruvate carboxykinase (GTP) [Desulfurococcus amylolyticus]
MDTYMNDMLTRLSRYASRESIERISRINNRKLIEWITEVAELLEPSSIFVNTGTKEDLEYIRRWAIEKGEEIPSKYNPLHTVHFDGVFDLARDRENTRILTVGGTSISMINTRDREEGLRELREIYKGIMKGKEMYIGFYCFGPKDSSFTLYGVQVTDSAYVMHSENILYRVCYDVFVEKGESLRYMRFLHSTGELNEYGWSKNVSKRRIYVDLLENMTYSVNTQYAGNTVGLKKLSLRLCVYQGYREGWLCEHMFIVGVKGPGDRVSYFTGAFPAGCGKTSTALIADTVVGDDLAIIRNVNGEARGVNPEVGMFGIIDGVNPVDDPEIYRILTSRDTEVIFANVLLTEDGEVWWNGKTSEPRKGINYAGEWWPGKLDEKGKPVPPSHPNARFTTSIFYLSKVDPRINDPMGVPVHGMIFGGRDSDTWVPVEEAFNWVHGIVTKAASLESERTTAVLGKAGEREFNPFAILDFLSISPGDFINLHFKFGEELTREPRIYGVNYFLRDDKGRYLTEKVDKRVWLKWMELRANNDVDVLETPTGFIPLYDDLAELFRRELNKEFPVELYEKLFTIRVGKHLEKAERIYRIYYEKTPETPRLFFDTLLEHKRRLKQALDKYGSLIPPSKLDRR